ncbi:chemotaxis protein CheW [Pararhodospirillum oryzae]|uniref:Chemotaxis protein CheW n=1 Tax=Pararhodospirillum oryzae TaxID=478448 RepID=A0A512H7B1_9PROT|nr:chemotaxis protein CheW [Pararhodospirillum oryzae]GEO81342.1 chemotaxis protein CheW [Pararhodospirillum oryzae]
MSDHPQERPPEPSIEAVPVPGVPQPAGPLPPEGARVGVGASGTKEESDEIRQFVIFHVADEMVAVPLSEVQEIIRLPDMVCLPLSPAALEGLANLRGSVLPVIRLRRVFGLGDVDHDDATRVVVLDQGRPVGLVVDKVANVVSVEASRIEPARALGQSIDTDLLTGIIKGRDGQSMVMIFDGGKVVRHALAGAGGGGGHGFGASVSGLHTDGTESHRQDDGNDDESQLVSFVVAGQEYALPIERVQEIVQFPPAIAEVPNTPSHVLGVMTLRNRLLPLVSLRDLFGLPAQAFSEATKIVVVSQGTSRGGAVGLVTDAVKEVLRVGRSVIDPMPPLLAQRGSLSEIDAICRLSQGQRLVSILSATRLFDGRDIPDPSADLAQEGQPMIDDKGSDRLGADDDEEQVVVFRLMNEEYGVPIGSVQEIVRVPEELTRVPKTPDFIEGVVNLRGVVLPVVDQRRRFGLPPMPRNDRQRIMVYTIRGVRTGFIVDAVSEVMRLPAAFIGPAPALSDEQQRLIRRVANIDHQRRMILLLDVDQLLDVRELAAVGDV